MHNYENRVDKAIPTSFFTVSLNKLNRMCKRFDTFGRQDLLPFYDESTADKLVL